MSSRTSTTDPVLAELEQAADQSRSPFAAVDTVQSSGFITILSPDTKGPIPWHYKDPDTGKTTDTTFYLRQVPDDTNKIFRDRNTSKEWKNGQLRSQIYSDHYGQDLIDYAIVYWKDLYAVDGTGSSKVSVPCERKYKVLLPERVQGEIIRLCLGKELGAASSGGR